MIIKCENCNAIYCIADKYIGSNGRKVKCSKCSHTWYIDSEYSQINHASIPHPGLAKPCKTNKSSCYLSYALAVILIVMQFTLFPNFWSKTPIIKEIYKQLGYYDSENFALDEFSFEVKDNNILVQGIITNNSPKTRELPFIRYRLLDRDKKVLFQYTDRKKNIILKQGEKYVLKSKIANITENDAYLELDFGSRLELSIK